MSYQLCTRANCQLYNSIKVSVPEDKECIVKVRGETITTLPVWETTNFVMGLHAGMHLEFNEWREGGWAADV